MVHHKVHPMSQMPIEGKGFESVVSYCMFSKKRMNHRSGKTVGVEILRVNIRYFEVVQEKAIRKTILLRKGFITFAK